MPDSDVPPGLRERKKIQTRLAIRRAAFQLFTEQGYANTTVEQIAEAAEVSPRTFYRYFGVKEAVLITDDKIEPIITAFAEAPPELPFVAAYRHAVAQVYGGLSEEEREDVLSGEQLMYSIPEARGLLYTDYVALIDQIADVLSGRGVKFADDFERRVVAGAIVGVLISAAHGTPLPDQSLDRALAILETRLA